MAIPHHITHCIAAPNPLKKFPQSHTKWNNSEKVILGFSSAPCTLSFLCTQQFPSPLFHKELTYTHHPPPEGGRNRAMHASSRATTRKYIYLPKDWRQRLKDNPSSPHTPICKKKVYSPINKCRSHTKPRHVIFSGPSDDVPFSL